MTIEELHTLVIGNDAIFQVYRDSKFIYRISHTVIEDWNVTKLSYEFPIPLETVGTSQWDYLPAQCAAVELWRYIKAANDQNLLELVRKDIRYECTDEMPQVDVIEVRAGARVVCQCGYEFGFYKEMLSPAVCMCGQKYKRV